MQEQKNYMSELDEWTTDQVIRPLNEFWKAKGREALDLEALSRTTGLIRRAIREKVLQSYHNGQNARSRGFQRPIRARK